MQEIRVPFGRASRSSARTSIHRRMEFMGTSFSALTGDERGVTAHHVFKQDGTKLTVIAGPDAGEQHAVENGKVESGSITFQVPTQRCDEMKCGHAGAR